MVAAPERTHIIVARAEPIHKMPATTTPRHVTVTIHESSLDSVDRHEARQVTFELHE